jgi:peptidoglycan/LPS O-acetylase OafA/YrhL
MKGKLEFIDATRGVAILMVLMVHVLQDAVKISSEPVSHIIEAVCGRGVQLFFIASAFTLFLSGNNQKPDQLNPNLNFSIRRIFRIAPMYYLGILYYLWQNGLAGQPYWLGAEGKISAGNIASNFLFVHGVNPYWINSLVPGGWSITIEMMFYLFVPLLVKFINSFSKSLLFLLVTFAFSVTCNHLLSSANPIASDYLWQDFLNIYFINQFPVFACGIVVYFFITEEIRRLSMWQVLTLVALFLLLFISRQPRDLYLVIGVAFGVFLLLLARYEWKIFINRFFLFLGKVSFSAYLVHFAVIYFLHKFSFFELLPVDGLLKSILSYVVALSVVVCISAIIANMFHHLVELPGQKLGRHLIKLLEKQKGANVEVVPVVAEKSQADKVF